MPLITKKVKKKLSYCLLADLRGTVVSRYVGENSKNVKRTKQLGQKSQDFF
jgi:hypothetical protein